MDKPEPTPEGALVRRVRLAAGLGIAACADALERRGIRLSVSRWSQIENGYEGSAARHKPVRAPAGTLAHMAHAVGIGPGRLEKVGRPDAAEVLREILRIGEPDMPAIVRDNYDDPVVRQLWETPRLPLDARLSFIERYIATLGGNGGEAEVRRIS